MPKLFATVLVLAVSLAACGPTDRAPFEREFGGHIAHHTGG